MGETLEQIVAARPDRFRPYPAYKDSGIEWLGKIPENWEAKRLKDCVSKLVSGGTPESGDSTYWTDDEVGTPWVAISDMTRSFHVRQTAKRLTERGLQSKRLPVLPSGTLLYSMYASLGKVALLEIDAVVNQAILGIVPRAQGLRWEYLRWWLEFMEAHVPMLSSSNTQDNLNADKVRTMPVYVPSSSEQRAIAAFLDRETARIDALVAKKERLIELLQEKRTALITRAVTEGLDPTVLMKDSGIEWLREIPAHWAVHRLKVLVRAIEQGWSPLCENRPAEDNEWGVLKVGCVNGAEFDEGENKALPVDLQPVPKYEIQAGDILMSRANTRELLGSAALVTRVRSRMLLCDKLYRIRLQAARLSPQFLIYALMSRVHRFHFEREATGASASMQNIAQETIGDLVLGVPPVDEQQAIARDLDLESTQNDQLRQRVRGAIERLKELRTTLVSAAVTGKIDVRETAAP